MMKRFQLTPSVFPENLTPKRFRGSTVAWWFYCAEQSRLNAIGAIAEEVGAEPAEVGTMLHKVLEESMGRRFPWEDEFLELLNQEKDKELGFIRKLTMPSGEPTKLYANLTGNPDDFQISPDTMVSVVEHKTVMKPNAYFIERYKLPVAKFQSQIYSFILEPIVQRLGGMMSRYNAVVFWKQPGEGETLVPFKSYPVEYYPTQARENIMRAFAAYENPEKVIPPQSWKCRQCQPKYKEKCQFVKNPEMWNVRS